jgi:3-deoxy-manno-octulosonate cytidylyltransferase (CMP-KDO synthetase)
MLLRETGRYLFEHTVRRVEEAHSIDRVVLATDAEEIMAAAAEVSVEALLTSADHPSGTDRVHEAAQALLGRGERPFDVVVNVQGDEPELPAADLDLLVAAFRDPDVEIATLYAPIEGEEEALDPSVVKVVLARNGDALYFSRSPIPSFDHPTRPMPPSAPGLAAMHRHLGVYGFRPEALARFCALEPGDLERTESLEQLRWLEAGGRIRVLEATRRTVGIDTPEDYALFVQRHAEEERPLEGQTTQ